MSTNSEIIGRDDIDDLEAILSVTNTERDEVIHAVTSNYDTIFTWDYEKGARPKLNRLYEKAKGAMWNAETDLPWDTEVDQAVVVANNTAALGGPGLDIDYTGTPDHVAGMMQEIMEEVGGDGFLIFNSYFDRRYVMEVCEGLVPALQRRGVVRTAYAHKHLRDNLLEVAHAGRFDALALGFLGFFLQPEVHG